MHLQLCFSLSFCLQLVFLRGFSTSIAWLDESFESSSQGDPSIFDTGAAKERPGYSKQTLANGSFLEPNGHPWIKMVVYNWMRVPKSSPWKNGCFTPHFPSFKKPVGFWVFLVAFYAMQKIKSFRFLWWSCGLMQDMKTDLQRLQGRCLDVQPRSWGYTLEN